MAIKINGTTVIDDSCYWTGKPIGCTGIQPVTVCACKYCGVSSITPNLACGNYYKIRANTPTVCVCTLTNPSACSTVMFDISSTNVATVKLPSDFVPSSFVVDGSQNSIHKYEFTGNQWTKQSETKTPRYGSDMDYPVTVNCCYNYSCDVSFDNIPRYTVTCTGITASVNYTSSNFAGAAPLVGNSCINLKCMGPAFGDRNGYFTVVCDSGLGRTVALDMIYSSCTLQYYIGARTITPKAEIVSKGKTCGGYYIVSHSYKNDLLLLADGYCGGFQVYSLACFLYGNCCENNFQASLKQCIPGDGTCYSEYIQYHDMDKCTTPAVAVGPNCKTKFWPSSNAACPVCYVSGVTCTTPLYSGGYCGAFCLTTSGDGQYRSYLVCQTTSGICVMIQRDANYNTCTASGYDCQLGYWFSIPGTAVPPATCLNFAYDKAMCHLLFKANGNTSQCYYEFGLSRTTCGDYVTSVPFFTSRCGDLCGFCGLWCACAGNGSSGPMVLCFCNELCCAYSCMSNGVRCGCGYFQVGFKYNPSTCLWNQDPTALVACDLAKYDCNFLELVYPHVRDLNGDVTDPIYPHPRCESRVFND